MIEQQPSRRARYRAATREEAKEIALRQLASGGPEAISLNAIGKAMGTSGPALYRYFAGRDALLTELIIDAYRDLATTIEDAAGHGDAAAPSDKLRALAAAIRAWALAHPHRYLLLYGTPVPGYVAPAGTVSLARRILSPFLAAIAALPRIPTSSSGSALDAQLAAWAEHTGQGIDGPVLRRGLVVWTRLHGAISLEVEGHFDGMGFDPSLLYDIEVDALLAEMGAAERTTSDAAAGPPA